MIKLGVNIDHVATVRQARKESIPNLLEAARAAIKAGADGITAHLREDRRHIQDKDIFDLKAGISVPLNMEMAASDEIIAIAEKVKPQWACLVPEKRQELTTEGGLDVEGNKASIEKTIQRLHAVGTKVSLFIDPTIDAVSQAKELSADAVELHTGQYARLFASMEHGFEPHKRQIKAAAEAGRALGLIVNAGHGIDYKNVRELKQLFAFNEFNIGFALVARALTVGLAAAVKEMKEQLN